MKIKNNFGWSMAEMIIVCFIASFFITITYNASKIIKMSRLSNAVNITGQAFFIEDDSLVLWLETSSMSKNVKKGTETINGWKDLSKNKINLTTNSGTLDFNESKVYSAIKAIKFNGSNYLETSTPLNVDEYTAIIVATGDNASVSSQIISSGFVITSGEIDNNKITFIKNNGTTKSSKKINQSNFTNIASHSDNLIASPSNMYIGKNSFKGEILEIIVFDKILTNKEILKMEEYLNNKYKS